VTSPNPKQQQKSQTRGENFLRRMLDGISKRMYGMKKIVRAVLNCVLLLLLEGLRLRFRSRSRLKARALAMLTRSRKARR